MEVFGLDTPFVCALVNQFLRPIAKAPQSTADSAFLCQPSRCLGSFSLFWTEDGISNEPGVIIGICWQIAPAHFSCFSWSRPIPLILESVSRFLLTCPLFPLSDTRKSFLFVRYSTCLMWVQYFSLRQRRRICLGRVFLVLSLFSLYLRFDAHYQDSSIGMYRFFTYFPMSSLIAMAIPPSPFLFCILRMFS